MVKPTQKIAFLFPGQGAVPEAPVADCLGSSVETTYRKFACKFTPPLASFQQATITSDQAAQLGVFHLSLALALDALDYCQPSVITGYSSGLYAAMVASGCLSPAEGNQAITLAYTGVKQTTGDYRMVGVIGLHYKKITEILRALSPAGQISLVNNKSQVIVSILKSHLRLFKEQCTKAGALNIIDLPFTYPYHVRELGPASDELDHYFTSLHLSPLLIPMVAGSTPEYIQHDSTQVAHLVADQLKQTVWWYKTILCLQENGAETFVVFDPTGTLTRIIRWISRQITTIGITCRDDLKQLQGL